MADVMCMIERVRCTPRCSVGYRGVGGWRREGGEGGRGCWKMVGEEDVLGRIGRRGCRIGEEEKGV